MANLHTTNYLCPACNGGLHWDAASSTLKCEFCGNMYDPAQIEAYYAQKQAAADAQAQQSGAQGQGAAQQQAQQGYGYAPQQSAAQASMAEVANMNVDAPAYGEDPVQAYLARSKWDDAEAEGMKSYNCPSCGAVLMTDQTTAVSSCPYCGNPAVMPGTLSGALKPDCLIPFKVDKEGAIAAVKKFYEGKRFIPDAFVSNNHLQDIQGVYVPFWLFTSQATGQARFSAEKVMTRRDSMNEYIMTETYQLVRGGTMNFDRVPVDASTRMPNTHMDAIEPFDYRELKAFSVGYLPGFVTDRYDQDAKTCMMRANERIKKSMSDELAGSASAQGFSSVALTGAQIQVGTLNIEYALLPVWMLYTKWNNQDFLFAINGQTGKAIGDLPTDMGKVNRHALTMFLIVAIVIAAILILVLR